VIDANALSKLAIQITRGIKTRLLKLHVLQSVRLRDKSLNNLFRADYRSWHPQSNDLSTWSIGSHVNIRII